MRLRLIGVICFCSSLSVFGQTATDSIVTIVKQLEEVEVMQHRSATFVEQKADKMVVDVQQIKDMPKFLGTSDPIRYLQSLAGVQTNNESATGLHIQGCDDYQSLVSINGAPIFYPNHLLGLYSTFIAPHFNTINLEQAEHKGTMPNRLGGLVEFNTFNAPPKRFGIEGNVGVINSDLTLSIPIGKKHAVWASGRSSYINGLYSRFLRFEDYNVRYHFMDFNLTYLGNLTEKDQLVVTGFYSRDKMGLFSDRGNMQMEFPWQNIVGSAYWNHRIDYGNWRTTVYYSSFDNQLRMKIDSTHVRTNERIASTGMKNRFDYAPWDSFRISASMDYEHYMSQPLAFAIHNYSLFSSDSTTKQLTDADEFSIGADLRHNVNHWFAYNMGLHLSGYFHSARFWWAADPRVSFHFMLYPHHTLSLHYGLYHQYFHKSGLTGGGLPTDFYFMASERFRPECAHSISLKYFGSFLDKQYDLSAELYFKQIDNIAESTGNVLQVMDKQFSFEDHIITGKGRNYGLNIMFQRNKGIVTGYLSYTLGWARRALPGLEGFHDYRYAASSERRNDLKLVLNSHFAKRWTVSTMFVLASGVPYTEAKEAYMLNGRLVCLYSTYNGAHLPLYNRLDLSCSCDIIKNKEHELGINLSLYNAYAYKNAQFVVYRSNLKPIYGTTLSTIIPSISIYGKF